MLHKKKKLQSGQKFMLCLAYVDFFACVYCVPMIPVNIRFYLHERFASQDHLWITLYRMPFSTVVITYIFVTITMALDRVHATSRPYSYKPPKMTSFLWIFLAVGIYQLVLYFGLIGWLPFLVMRLQAIAMWVLAVLITVTCYTVVAYKVKRQGQKIAGASRGGGAPAKSNAAAMTVNKSTNEALPPVAVVPQMGTKPVSGDANISRHEGQGNEAVVTAAAVTTTTKTTKCQPKLETRMLKLCLGITCLAAVSYTALFARIVLDLSFSFDYLYSLNHVGNPVIYCLISKAYRKDVLGIRRYARRS